MSAKSEYELSASASLYALLKLLELFKFSEYSLYPDDTYRSRLDFHIRHMSSL